MLFNIKNAHGRYMIKSDGSGDPVAVEAADRFEAIDRFYQTSMYRPGMRFVFTAHPAVDPGTYEPPTGGIALAMSRGVLEARRTAWWLDVLIPRVSALLEPRHRMQYAAAVRVARTLQGLPPLPQRIEVSPLDALTALGPDGRDREPRAYAAMQALGAIECAAVAPSCADVAVSILDAIEEK